MPYYIKMSCDLSRIINCAMTVPLIQKMSSTCDMEDSPFLKELRLLQ